MSHADGWAAINLEMPPRVPRTEYSAAMHWDLIKAVTGIDVGVDSPEEVQDGAARAFMKAWSYDFRWSILVAGKQAFGELRTDMGHAAYAAGGVDRSDTITCPFKTPEEVLAFDPWKAYGAIDKPAWAAKFREHYLANCRHTPDLVNMTGIYVTCVSGLIDIFGWELLLLAAGTDPDGFGALTDRYCSWIMQYFEALGAADVPVVMIHDDIVWTSGAIFPPAWYRKHVFPNYRKLFAPVLDSGKRLIYTSDGNYTEFIDDVAASGVHGFVMEPTTDMKYVAGKYGRTHVFIGNADTRILLFGSKQQIRSEVERCMAIGKSCPGFFMAVGNHIPPNTPVENALYYNQVYEQLARR